MVSCKCKHRTCNGCSTISLHSYFFKSAVAVMRVVLAMQDEYEKEDKHREEEEWHMLSKDEQVPILHQGPRKLIKIA